jgi:hypothetical protein
MLLETISRIEEQLKGNDALDAVKKQELLSLVEELKKEASALAETHGEDARSIASFTETSVHEATRGERNEELLGYVLEGMKLSVRHFEVSHPKLVSLVDAISRTLWEIGI